MVNIYIMLSSYFVGLSFLPNSRENKTALIMCAIMWAFIGVVAMIF